MLLDTLNDERNEVFAGDALMADLHHIAADGSAQQRAHSEAHSNKSPIGAKTAKDLLNTKEQRSSRSTATAGAAKTNGTSSEPAAKLISDRAPLQCRANSLKRAMHNVDEHTKLLNNQQKRSSQLKQQQEQPTGAASAAGGGMDNLCVANSSSSDNTPWSSPVPPNINLLSPSVSTTQLTCISPLPDLRRDSMDEYFFDSVSELPVPNQFADSRRGSANVPHSIAEQADDEHDDGGDGGPTVTSMAHLFPMCRDARVSAPNTPSPTPNSYHHATTSPQSATSHQLSTNISTIQPSHSASAGASPISSSDSNNVVTVVDADGGRQPPLRPRQPRVCHLDYLADRVRPPNGIAGSGGQSNGGHSDDGINGGLMPAEAFERAQLRKFQQQQQQQHSLASAGRLPLPVPPPPSMAQMSANNMLQVPSIVVPVLEIQRPPVTFNENVYVSDSMTIIDTDAQVGGHDSWFDD